MSTEIMLEQFVFNSRASVFKVILLPGFKSVAFHSIYISYYYLHTMKATYVD